MLGAGIAGISAGLLFTGRDANQKYDPLRKLYGLESKMRLYSLDDEIYYKKDEGVIYLIGEAHATSDKDGNFKLIDVEKNELNEPTLKKIHHLLSNNKIDVVSLEGLEGRVTAETLNQINEDKNQMADVIRMSRKHDDYMVISYLLALSEQGIHFNINLTPNRNRPFLGVSPGAYIAPALIGDVEIFGWETMSLYQQNLERRFYDKLLFARKKISDEEELSLILGSSKMPSAILKNKDRIFNLIGEQIELLRNSGNFLLGENYNPLDSFNNDYNKIVITQRSRIAVMNTSDYMKQNDYKSSIIIIGDYHLPTVKDISAV